MKLVNLTPHEITIQGIGTIMPENTPARVSSTRVPVENSFGIRIIQQEYGEITGLPDPEPNVLYIVSAVVLSALNGKRDDVFSPDTGPDAIRNHSGQVIAVLGLSKIAKS